MQGQGTDTVAASGAETGLRDRKRARTRQAIRTAGLDLFEEQGFEGTTVDQICRRADVAHRTFFRYYACKEALLFGLAFGAAVLDAFEAAPAELGLWAAFGHAVRTTDGQFEELAEHTARRRALRRRFMDVRSVHDYALVTIDSLVQRSVAIAGERLGVDPAVDLRPHVFGAALGGMVRRHVVLGSEAGMLEAWAEALREVFGPEELAFARTWSDREEPARPGPEEAPPPGPGGTSQRSR
ncbi:TetR family transcriptional regulator [Kitasatospora sp. NPDC002965]|uniref:TetR family transcriptional regulator n=1 Tax=Kitasatospora sp. NPDC002965 TaxID=3154775 RepID=UPI0033B92B91